MSASAMRKPASTEISRATMENHRREKGKKLWCRMSADFRIGGTAEVTAGAEVSANESFIMWTLAEPSDCIQLERNSTFLPSACRVHPKKPLTEPTPS